jgi:hypothetical protein
MKRLLLIAACALTLSLGSGPPFGAQPKKVAPPAGRGDNKSRVVALDTIALFT